MQNNPPHRSLVSSVTYIQVVHEGKVAISNIVLCLYMCKQKNESCQGWVAKFGQA